MELSFHGAAGGVTGSCHLLRVGGQRILIDCGLFQGERDLEEENAGEFGFDPREIDLLLLTHAHLDHCGRVPLLVKRGLRGRILTTAATRDLARLVLLDAAGLQMEEVRRHARKRARRGEPSPRPLYDVPDVLDAFDHFAAPAGYEHPIQHPIQHPIGRGSQSRITFGDAGHILGSAWILIEVEERGERRRLVFSGDLGNRGKPLLSAPVPAPAADVVIMESTYGDRVHKSVEASVAELKQAILETLERGGNVIIPTFALERAQDLLYFIGELIARRELPGHLQVFLDSPLAISATDVFRHHPEALSPAVRASVAEGRDPFALPGLHFVRDTVESMALNAMRGAVIMAGSGMATGGRIVHHLKHNLWRKESGIVFVGYAAEGTLARQIIDGHPAVRVAGEEVHVAAHIYTIGGFSAHADRDELLDWYRSSGSPTHTFLVHGEDRAREALAAALRAQGRAVELPRLGDAYEV
jgi:metallo-beta-lactamase family protein